jgi:hypothetical protein
MDDLGAADARKPDGAAVPATVQIAAGLVLIDKGHENVRHVGHRPARGFPVCLLRLEHGPPRSRAMSPAEEGPVRRLGG